LVQLYIWQEEDQARWLVELPIPQTCYFKYNVSFEFFDVFLCNDSFPQFSTVLSNCGH
jgi:hypothetical protein